MDAIFSKILRKEIPAVFIYEDERTAAFLDVNPVNKGHVLVVPKQASQGLVDADPEDLRAVIVTVQKVAKALKAGLNVKGINITQNEGAVAGQKVFHLHFHLIPRFDGDGLELWHGKPYASDVEAEEVAARIRGSLDL